ncbi:hypothetical protein LINPERPRIM_LOCUS14012 [Linum perenne]
MQRHSLLLPHNSFFPAFSLVLVLGELERRRHHGRRHHWRALKKGKNGASETRLSKVLRGSTPDYQGFIED